MSRGKLGKQVVLSLGGFLCGHRDSIVWLLPFPCVYLACPNASQVIILLFVARHLLPCFFRQALYAGIMGREGVFGERLEILVISDILR